MNNNYQSFAQFWKRAEKQGWRLVSINDNKDSRTVFPPKNHPAAKNHWAAIYTNVNFKNKIVAVPHWFYSEMRKAPNYKLNDYYRRTKQKVQHMLKK
ncbi:unnamed protein product [Adineta ricciae]|uniref:Uncharacterized protein n=1 Tax=Adineta ricciae TaxID=249248 RepID=A0A814S4U9_ADIRI|nr:unnamed protein product [Adineta ricciae]CAF1251893.1 unnamed protein product [Adineta ricciae]